VPCVRLVVVQKKKKKQVCLSSYTFHVLRCHGTGAEVWKTRHLPDYDMQSKVG
jgi:hypothetical protein